MKIVARIIRADPTAQAVARRAARRDIQRLLDEVESLTGETFDEVHRLVRQRLAEVGAHQGTVAAAQLRGTIQAAGVRIALVPGRVGINRMKAILDASPIDGDLLVDWFEGQAENVLRRVRRQLRVGMARGETMDQLIVRIRGRRIGPGRYVGGALQTSHRDAEAIVRTAVTHVANVAHFETYSANGDLTEEYDYVAVLDSRTTLQCIGADAGSPYRYDDRSAPRPPLHIRCRSTIVPRIAWAKLGIEPPAGLERRDYEAWLREQPEERQNEILGPRRAEMFRRGELDLRELVRSDFTIVTLDELRGRAA
jgi:SPP1 gp7 family putative phage head morphogenesis protein